MNTFNIQKTMSEFFLSSCYAYCLAYIYDPNINENKPAEMYKQLTGDVINGYFKGYIADDGFVSDPVAYVNSLDPLVRVKVVKHVDIKSLQDIPKGTPVAVKYKLGNLQHFIVVKDGKTVFNPYPGSSIADKGKPVSYREFIYE